MILLIRSLEPNRIGGTTNSSPAVFFLVFKPSSSVFSRSSRSSNRTEDLLVGVIFLWFDSCSQRFSATQSFFLTGLWSQRSVHYDDRRSVHYDQCIMISALWWLSIASLILVSLSLPFSCFASGHPLSFSIFVRCFCKDFIVASSNKHLVSADYL